MKILEADRLTNPKDPRRRGSSQPMAADEDGGLWYYIKNTKGGRVKQPTGGEHLPPHGIAVSKRFENGLEFSKKQTAGILVDREDVIEWMHAGTLFMTETRRNSRIYLVEDGTMIFTTDRTCLIPGMIVRNGVWEEIRPGPARFQEREKGVEPPAQPRDHSPKIEPAELEHPEP